MNFTNVLVSIEPWIEASQPGWKQNYIWWFGNMIRAMAEAAPASLRTVMLLGDDCAPFWEKHLNCDAEMAVIRQPELKEIFPDARTALAHWLKRSHSDSSLSAMGQLVERKLAGFQPDVIFSITPAPFLEKLFPRALVLYRDAMYCRQPWPDEMTCFDPVGINVESLIGQFAPQLLALPNTPQSRAFIGEIDQLFLQPIVDANPLYDAMAEHRSRFKHLVLVPLQSSGHYNFYTSTSFSGQFDYLTHVLDRVPPHVGVVATQHPDDATFTPAALEYLRATYPHFIYEEATAEFHAPSQFLLPLVDGLICVSSGLCYQALLWNKPIFIVGKSHFSPYAAGRLEELGSVLEAPRPARATGLMAWLLSHYFLQNSYLTNGQWFGAYIDGLREAKRAGRTGLDLFAPVDTPEKLLEVLASTRREVAVLKPGKGNRVDERDAKIAQLEHALQHEREATAHLQMVLRQKDAAIEQQHAALQHIRLHKKTG